MLHFKQKETTMKKIIAVLLASFASPVFASVSCDDIATVATKMMQFRQSGDSYQSIVRAIPTDDADLTRLFKAVVDEAYKHQVYQRPSTQIAVTNEFTEVWRTACLRTQQ